LSLSLFSSDYLSETTKAEANLTIKMGLQSETCKELRRELVTKIHGQPKDQDITTLKKELISITASIPSALARGNHGHAGIIVKLTKCLAMARVAFNDPNHPGIYSAGLAGNAVAGT
jgi:hypothetical protein